MNEWSETCHVPSNQEEEIVQFYLSALVDMRNFLLDYANQFSIVLTNRRYGTTTVIESVEKTGNMFLCVPLFALLGHNLLN